MTRRLIKALICGLMVAGAACGVMPRAQTPAQTVPAARPAADPNKFAVIISGASGEEVYAKQFARWTTELRGVLVGRLGFAEDRLKILAESAGEGTPAARATAEEVRRAFESLRGAAGPESTLFVFFIGHGTFDGKQAKFNLVGPDITAGEYASLLGAVPCRRVVVFNLSSASGEFAKTLAGRGRVVVTATRSGQEQNAPRFAEHFIAALTGRESDADQNGRVSVLEAFDYAARLTAEHYKRSGRLATEHALLEDSGDGVGHEKAEGGDGDIARATYFDSLTVEQAAANAEVGRLLRERTRYEEEIGQLKTRKREMAEGQYESELERLFVGLAKTNRSIKRGGQ
ncbi:MAG TPA: hypothetical protein VF240_13475 [Pyrinomonadaceae bacterium]